MTTLGGNQDSALGSTATIKHHSLGTFQEGNLLDLRGQHVVGLTGYTVDQHELVGETPHTIAVITGHITLQIVKAIGIVVLIHQVSVVHAGDTTQNIFLGHLAECHIDLGGICRIDLCLGRHSHRQSQKS